MPSRTLLLAVALSLGAPPAFAQDKADASLDAQRERFRAGADKYRAGAYAEAILIWETIYNDLGPEKGYRLAFNLARAYEQFGNPTHAAESYETYLKEVARRRAAGEQLEAVVEKQEAEARNRLTELDGSLGRIHITGDHDTIVTIDGGTQRLARRSGLIVYVTPDRNHTITFNPGTTGEQVVSRLVERGKQIELSPPELPPAPPQPAIDPRALSTPLPQVAQRFETREERPFSKNILYVAGGITVVSVIVPIVLYANAFSVKSDYDTTGKPAAAGQVPYPTALLASQHANYDSARSAAYGSIAIPAVLGAATAGLAVYWLFGTKETRVPISAGVVPGGCAAFASGSF